jgi:DNA (cytosine-5)-methyltransferase 1
MVYESQPYAEPAHPVGTVAELFAGVGGFRVGLGRAGWKTVFSNQWEPSSPKNQAASKVYALKIQEQVFDETTHITANIADVIRAMKSSQLGLQDVYVHDDLTNQDIEVFVPKFDMLVGGFPCQDYSVAKARSASRGLEGKKGVLWWELLEFIRITQPPIVFLENVDRLLKSPANQRGRDFAIMLSSLIGLSAEGPGYSIEWRVVNAANYGGVQKRRRVFIVAKRLDVFPWSDLDPKKILTEQGTFARALPVETDLAKEIKEHHLDGDLLKLTHSFGTSSKRSDFCNAGYAIGTTFFTTDLVPKTSFLHQPRTMREVLLPEKEIAPEFFVGETPEVLEAWKGHKESKSTPRTHAGGGTYVFAEGSMRFPDPVDEPARTILTSEGGKSPSRTRHIIKPGKRHRRLTPVELERLNGFPDGWTESGISETGSVEPMSNIKRAFFMGNALVVDIVQQIGIQLAQEWASAIRVQGAEKGS